MKYVKRQLEIIRDMVDDLLSKCSDRSFWKKRTLPNRVQEAKAIQKATEALIEIVRRAKPE